MRIWSRMVLIAWLLTGLLAAPAMAWNMTCHAGTSGPVATAHVMAHAMHFSVEQNTLPQQAKDAHDKSALSCTAHCLNACTGFVIGPYLDAMTVAGIAVRPHFHLAPLQGLVPGPALEPPIPLSV